MSGPQISYQNTPGPWKWKSECNSQVQPPEGDIKSYYAQQNIFLQKTIFVRLAAAVDIEEFVALIMPCL